MAHRLRFTPRPFVQPSRGLAKKHNAPFQSRFVVHYLTNKVPNAGRSLVVRFVLSLSVVIALTALIPLNRWTASAQTQTSTLVLSPADTYLGLNSVNNSTSTTLNTYTWPNNQVANAIVMKFD